MRKLLLIVLLYSVSQLPARATIYFPPVLGNSWDTVSLTTLGWCPDKMDTLIRYLGQHNTKAFILLKDGKIVTEHYYGTFTADSAWQWNSAGKSLAGFLTGLAQEQGYLNIQDSLPKYLHHGFSSCTTAAEDAIRIRHQLTMTTGFDDLYGSGTENHCTDDTCLVCIAAPGTRWAYHNAPYTLLHWVLDSATRISLNTFTRNNLLTSCGITGTWVGNLPTYPYDEIYFSKARSMARFGLLILARGKWNNTTVMQDTAYFNQMTNSSQTINPAYGYLWWLNGKSSYRLPSLQFTFNGPLVPHAPSDMIAALGKNDQILNVVPSKGLVLVRMGDAFGTALEVGNAVDDSIWVRLNDVFCNTLSAGSVAASGVTSALQVFPNPARDQLALTYNGPDRQAMVNIVNPEGQLVYNGTVIKGQQAIDVSRFPEGMYLIILQDETGIYRMRFIKE